MIARIKTKTGFYDSVVFALAGKGWDLKVLVLNENYNKLEFIKIWGSKRNIFIYNSEECNDWIQKRKISGFDWVLKSISKKFFKFIINNDILDRCNTLQANIENCEQFEIKNKNDILGLMWCSCDFHDSYVKKMYMESGKQYIQFDTTWGCDIIFELDGDVKTNLFENYGRVTNEDGEYLEIFDSSMFFENGLIYWANDESVQSFSDLISSKCYYFSAKNVKWELIIH